MPVRETVNRVISPVRSCYYVPCASQKVLMDPDARPLAVVDRGRIWRPRHWHTVLGVIEGKQLHTMYTYVYTNVYIYIYVSIHIDMKGSAYSVHLSKTHSRLT